MKRLQTCSALFACGLLASACNESSFSVQDPATVDASGSLPSTATAGQSVSPAVLVRDSRGQPVPAAVVTFQVTAGGGTVSSATATTNNSGVATVTWVLGAEQGVNTLVASIPSVDEVTFTVTGCGGEYCIDIRYVGTVTAAQEAAFTNARRRWEEVIAGNLPSVQMNVTAGQCKDADGNAIVDHPAVNEVVDDLLVFVQIDSIDGPNGVLGTAGPCFIRNTSRLPVLGIMRFDRADLLVMEQNNLLGDVILHELGHVLGFPTIWEEELYDLLVGAGTDNPYFTGSAALSAFQLAGGAPVNDVGVPVENTGGEGSGSGRRAPSTRRAASASSSCPGRACSGSSP